MLPFSFSFFFVFIFPYPVKLVRYHYSIRCFSFSPLWRRGTILTTWIKRRAVTQLIIILQFWLQHYTATECNRTFIYLVYIGPFVMFNVVRSEFPRETFFSLNISCNIASVLAAIQSGGNSAILINLHYILISILHNMISLWSGFTLNKLYWMAQEYWSWQWIKMVEISIKI